MKNKINRVLIALLLIPMMIVAQKEDRIWTFGKNAGIDFNNIENPVFIPNVQLKYANTYANIADKDGKLLFYVDCENPNEHTQGLFNGKLYNYAFELIENGDSLKANSAIDNGAVIVPIPKTTLYYVFTVGPGPNYVDIFQLDLRIYWHLVDMGQNNGKGKVLSKNNLLPADIEIMESLCLVKSKDGKGYWLIAISRSTNKAIRFYIQDNQILGPYLQTTFFPDNYLLLEYSVSIEGNKLAYVDLRNTKRQIYLFNFDRCTGRLLNQQTIPFTPSFLYGGNIANLFGCAFSPDGKLLYVSSFFEVAQYDLTAQDIAQSKVTLGIIPMFSTTQKSHTIAQMERGPDGKIYVSKHGNTPQYDHPDNSYHHLGVIHNPNIKGLGCNFDLNGFALPDTVRICCGLPNMPNYNLGPLVGPYDMGLAWAASTVGTTATFENTTDCSTCSYVWHFGDGTTSTAVSPTHTYADTGSYTVQLVATSIYGGCTDTLAQVLSIGTPTGTAVPTAASFSVYPNPARERFTVALGAPTPCQLSLYNAVGRAVYRAQSTTPTHDIDVSTLPEGVYLLQVSTENRSFTKKLTVRR